MNQLFDINSIPEALQEHCPKNMVIIEVKNERVFNDVVSKLSGAIFHITYEGRFFIKGSKKFLSKVFGVEF
ncbi:MAG: hypothetical protein KatS3mg035_1071 [Bacteroidia bacterium]|nr:MAG: hypothetical protein KatS3mg035_1071 [Bacteroidia bacterium]